jgi:hypothetical protein
VLLVLPLQAAGADLLLLVHQLHGPVLVLLPAVHLLLLVLPPEAAGTDPLLLVLLLHPPALLAVVLPALLLPLPLPLLGWAE